MRIHVDRTRVNFLSLESLFFVFETPIINYCLQMFLGGLHILKSI